MAKKRWAKWNFKVCPQCGKKGLYLKEMHTVKGVRIVSLRRYCDFRKYK